MVPAGPKERQSKATRRCFIQALASWTGGTSAGTCRASHQILIPWQNLKIYW